MRLRTSITCVKSKVFPHSTLKIIMPRLTSAQALDIASRSLQAAGLSYDEQEGLHAHFIGQHQQGTGSEALSLPSHWRVSYVSEPNLFEQHDFFMHIADDTGTLLYILGPHGRLHL